MKSGAAFEEGSWSPVLRVGSKQMKLREVGRSEWWGFAESERRLPRERDGLEPCVAEGYGHLGKKLHWEVGVAGEENIDFRSKIYPLQIFLCVTVGRPHAQLSVCSDDRHCEH